MNPPCSVLDSTCNTLGYVLPDIILNSRKIPTPTPAPSPTPQEFNINTFSGPRLISISWTAQSGATSYKVYRKDTTGVTASDTEITNGGTTSLSFADSNLSTTTSRFYRVSYMSSGREILSVEKSNSPNPTGLALFLRSDSINQTDASIVNTWNDESGNGYNLSVTTPCTVGGSFRTNIQNSRPVVRFLNSPANTNCLARAQGQSPLMNNGLSQYPQTTFLVVRTSALTSQHIFAFGSTPAASRWNKINIDSTSIALGHGAHFGFASPILVPFSSFLGRFNILSFRSNLAALSYSESIYINGLVIGTVLNFTAAADFSIGNQITIASALDGATTNEGANMDFAEIIHYNRLMTVAEHNQVVCYLSSKYNISPNSDSGLSCQ